MMGFCMFPYLVSCNLADLSFSRDYFCRFLGIFYVDNHVVCRETRFISLSLMYKCWWICNYNMQLLSVAQEVEDDSRILTLARKEEYVFLK